MANHRDEKPLRELFSDLSTNLNKTMGEIKERLSPEHLRGRACEATVDRARRVYDSVAAKPMEWGSHLKENVREHPWSYALAGTGAAVGISGLVYFLSRKRGDHEEATESYNAAAPCC